MTVVSVAGAVDLATADVFATAVLDTVSGSPGQRVVLELNRLRVLDARGLGVVLAAHDRAVRAGGDLVLVVDDVAPPASILRFLPPEAGVRVHPTLTAALSRRDAA